MSATSDPISAIIDRIIVEEGSTFTSDPSDSGGPTKYGVTQQNLSEYLHRAALIDDVRDLTIETARLVHRKLKVTDPHFDRLLPVSERIAVEVIDTGVNCGTTRATIFLQRCLNALNRNGRDYPDIGADGVCGAATIGALTAYLRVRGAKGEAALWVALNCLQGEFYISLAERRPKDQRFLYGWLLNRVTLR
jgi:lysozyme family protein